MTKLEELIGKLSELFELDKADLDFGIHRIIKSKHKQISDYLQNRLPQRVNEELGKLAAEEAASELESLRTQVTASFGPTAIDEAGEISEAFASTPLGTKYADVRAAAAGAQAASKTENEVYSHLLEFFSRYYEDADFLSLRRRTAGRESYSIPYNGEEVVLHWANKDQYYIKSSEDMKDYTFTVPLSNAEDSETVRVQLKLTKMDAVQSNNKANREFQLDGEAEITSTDDGLVIPFRFAEVKKKRAAAAELEWEQTVLEAVPQEWQTRLSAADTTYTGKGDRTVLQKHLRNYTKKNTSDYFIHKDLGGFLNRELDFYIKNEVMYLDDVESRPANYLESEIRKIKAIRAVARDLIEFLAQFENFQKKLWLKKKFVLETNWCITLDRISEELYPEIAANESQRTEWNRLFALDSVDSDGEAGDLPDPMTVEFLSANPQLPVDTVFFSRERKYALLERIEDVSSATSGLLVDGDNFHALSLLQRSYANQVVCQFIDPPYNTGSDEFVYKDGYKGSSWLAMVTDRIQIGRTLLSENGSFAATIDENEVAQFRMLLDVIFGSSNFVSTIAWQKLYTIKNSSKYLSAMYDAIHVFALNKDIWRPNLIPRSDEQDEVYGNPDDDPNGPYITNALQARNYYSQGLYELVSPGGRQIDGPPSGTYWRMSETSFRELDRQGKIWWGVSGTALPRVKRYLKDIKDGVVPVDYWLHQFAGTNAESKTETRDLLGEDVAGLTPKPIQLLRRIIQMNCSADGIVCDYFAGSGTTAEAVISQNRSDQGTRKYLLIESGPYFDTVLRSRVLRTSYSSRWSDGLPIARDGISYALKYIRLESYDDTLDNLALEDRSPDLLGEKQEVQDEYLLRYCLELETTRSLLDACRFNTPFDFVLKTFDRCTGNVRSQQVDLPETFNYLLGLKVRTMQMKEGALVIEGENPAGETVLVIWRNVDEMDNEKLDEFVSKTLRINTADTEYAAIYINGDTTLNDPHKKILLTEEVFHALMFDVEDV